MRGSENETYPYIRFDPATGDIIASGETTYSGLIWREMEAPGSRYIFVDEIAAGDWVVVSTKIDPAKTVQVFRHITRPRKVDLAEKAARLEMLREAAIEAVDAAAEQARLVALTPGAGQQAEYAVALAQARTVLADPDAPAQMIADGAARNGRSLAKEAAAIIAAAEASDIRLALIRNTRLTAKAAIRKAKTQDQIETARAAFAAAISEG